MPDRRDVIAARQEAADALGSALSYGASIEDGRTGDPSLAILLAAGAVCAEISALATLIDFATAAHTSATGRL